MTPARSTDLAGILGEAFDTFEAIMREGLPGGFHN